MTPEQILESISGGFFAVDNNFRFTYWNNAAEHGTGFSKQEVLGKHIFEIFPNAEKSELGERYKLALQTQTFQSLVTRYKDSRFEKWYDVRIYPNENGLSVFFQDITEHKHQEHWQQTLLQISHIINTSNNVEDLCQHVAHTLSVRCEIPPHHTLLYLQRKHDKKLVLMSQTQLLQREKEPIPLLLSPHFDTHNNSLLIESFTTGKLLFTSDIAKSVYYNTAPELVVSSEILTVLALPLCVGNEVIGVCECIFHQSKELTERSIPFLTLIANEVAMGISRRTLIDELRVKNVDLEMQRSQTVEAHATLRRFLAYFSHELRAPLNSIIGFSDIIASDIAKLSEETIRNYVQSINSGGKHLLHMINDILDLSKIESGKLELFYTTIPLYQFFTNLKEELFPLLKEKNLDLQLHITEELEEITADSVRLKQIILNLLSNAIKFSNPNNKIILRIERNGYDIEFSVQDFGVGMHPEDATKIFHPFQQVGSATKQSEGTGLGLSITKKLVELHNGSITLHSEWQQGTTFIVQLPIMVNVENTNETITQRIASLQSEKDTPLRVLIVEDKPNAYTLLNTYLTEASYVTELARNGEEALEKAKLWKPDVITLDILLPVKDGWQVMRELKEHPLCKDIPVIIVSMMDERNLGFGLGAVEYCVKPVQKNELLSAMKKITQRIPEKKSNKILVIDDDDSVTDLVQIILENEGCTVLKAHNGKKGLELAEKEQPDLIILDLVMPEISGFSVAHHLKKHSSTFNIPIMVITSMELDEEMREQLDGFVVSMVSKSGFTKRDLLQEISSVGKRP